jgi:translation initiation factor IF-2
MRKPIAGAAVAAAIVATAVAACGTSTPAVVRAPEPKPTVTKTVTAKPVPAAIKTVKPKPAVTKTAPQAPTPVASAPVASAPAPAPAASTPSAAPAAGYLGDVSGGGTGNPCNFASGYQSGVCNPTGETEQQYIDNPGGPAPGTSTNAQGCYYVRMGEGYCPSTGQTIPMQDPNG